MGVREWVCVRTCLLAHICIYMHTHIYIYTFHQKVTLTKNCNNCIGSPQYKVSCLSVYLTGYVVSLCVSEYTSLAGFLFVFLVQYLSNRVSGWLCMDASLSD